MDRTVRHSHPFVLVVLGAGAAAYLYLNLFRLPHTPLVLGGDQLYFWMNAYRMLFGERIYQDFFQATPPGTDLVYFAAFRMFGAQVATANAVVLLLGVALCLVCFRIAEQMTKRSLALLCSLFFLAFL